MNTVLFDLDGTLLRMDQEEFVGDYFKRLTKRIAAEGIDSGIFLKALKTGVNAMVNNDGTMTNEECFWQVFGEYMGEKISKLEPVFIDFYENEFNEVQSTTSLNPMAEKYIELLKEKGYMLVLATNPLFPPVATRNRIRWAGLKPEDFDYITTYDNSSYCKPSLGYYREILQKIGRHPEDCIMIGNDIGDDMVAADLGMETFLLKDCLINHGKADISSYRQGGIEELYQFLLTLPDLNAE